VFDTFDECLDALEKGEVDLLMASEHTLITQTRYREKPNYKVNLRLSAPMDSYFGFNKDERMLCSIVCKAQQFVPTNAIETYWTGRAFDYSKRIAEQRVFYLMIFSGAILLLLIVFVYSFLRILKLSKTLREIASKDTLTDIFNRRHFMELAAIQLARSFRMNSRCFVVIFDLDHFKSVNDRYGHLAGDQVLKETARRIKNAIRPYDLFGRYGGEEFILLLTDVSQEDAISVVERFRKILCKTPVEYQGRQIPVSGSFGITAASSTTDMDVATKQADDAMYQAKAEGRNRVVFYTESVYEADTIQMTPEPAA